MEGFGNSGAAGGFEADDAVHFIFLAENRRDAIVGKAGVAFVVDRLRDLDALWDLLAGGIFNHGAGFASGLSDPHHDWRTTQRHRYRGH